MSVFSWIFSRNKTPPMPSSRDSSGLPSMEATRPIGRGSQPSNPEGSPTPRVSTRKTERMAKRERLYGVVRDAMMRAGVLSSGYKFKVLSLDPRGQQFLIMVDLARGYDGATSSLPEIEAMIAQQAKVRHDIAVNAVYWRMIEHVAVGSPQRASGKPEATPAVPAPGAAVVGAAASGAVALAAAAPAATPEPVHSEFPATEIAGEGAPSGFVTPEDVARARGASYEPLRADEIEAFRRALASGARAPSAPPSAPPDPGQNYALLTGFEDTELTEADGDPGPLSGTQYGELR